MTCPGSITLIRALGPQEEEDPDYRREGSLAHSFAAHCLERGVDGWEAIEDVPGVTADMATDVQPYLDYVRTLPGETFVETKLHRPEFHKDAYGTLDFAAITRTGAGLEIVDLKFGVGVVVEPERNAQAMYYGYLLVHDSADFADDEGMTLTICQPRIPWHPQGIIRSWMTTVGEVRRWAREELLPAMHATADAEFLAMGPHCRFCPAKIVCPLFLQINKLVLNMDPERPPINMSEDELGERYGQLELLAIYKKAITVEVTRRAVNGLKGAWKLVKQKTTRIFKPDTPLVEEFGDAAYEPREMRSVAQIEKLPMGKKFVAKWGYQPEAALTVAPLDDPRKAVEPKTGAQTFAGYQEPE